jgi:hypothetical protein
VWSRAPKIHSWYREFKILSWKIKSDTEDTWEIKPSADTQNLKLSEMKTEIAF